MVDSIPSFGSDEESAVSPYARPMPEVGIPSVLSLAVSLSIMLGHYHTEFGKPHYAVPAMEACDCFCAMFLSSANLITSSQVRESLVCNVVYCTVCDSSWGPVSAWCSLNDGGVLSSYSPRSRPSKWCHQSHSSRVTICLIFVLWLPVRQWLLIGISQSSDTFIFVRYAWNDEAFSVLTYRRLGGWTIRTAVTVDSFEKVAGRILLTHFARSTSPNPVLSVHIMTILLLLCP